MHTRSAAAVCTLASIVAPVVAAQEAPVPSLPTLAPRTVPLVWLDPAGVATGLEAVARQEARRLLERMGASVSWKRGEAGNLARPGEVRVVLLDRAAHRDPGTLVLGATPPGFGTAPLVWVHMPNVRAAIGLPSRGSAATIDPPTQRALAVALGRVIAHEVVHAIAPAVPHGRGLMAASLGRGSLTAARIAIEEGTVLGVQAALRGDPVLPGEGTGVLAAAADGREILY